MRTSLTSISLLLIGLGLVGGTAAASEQRAVVSVHIVARGSDSARAGSEWSKATFSYEAELAIPLQSDGELGDMNMYDPQFAEKLVAQANATMARMQAAFRGEFSDEEEVEPDERYMLFTGEMGCAASLNIKVNERLEGEYNDVGGMQPYTMTYSAQSSGAQHERDMLCVTGTGMLDVKDNVFYRGGLGLPEVTGHYVFHEKNRGNLQDDKEARQNALPRIVAEYLHSAMQVAPVKGHVKTTLEPVEPVVTRITGYDSYEGSIDVELSWDFKISR